MSAVAEGYGDSLARRVAGSALTLVARRVLIMAMGAFATALVARYLGPGEFGQLSSAMAIFVLACAASDFGFSLVLGRDMAAGRDDRGPLLRGVVILQVCWSILLAFALAGLALALGPDDGRGGALLVLAPALAIAGLGGARQVFMVLYETRRLAAIDLTVTALQVTAMILVAMAGAGPIGVAAAISAGTAVNALVVAWCGGRLLGMGVRGGVHGPRRLLRRAAPLGAIHLMSHIYLSIDLVLLGWIVTDDALGEYAAAVKLYVLLVAVPGLVLSAALPGFSEMARDTRELAALAARVWHWLCVAGLPACIGLALFAEPIVSVAFGSDYEGAVVLTRILALAAALALVASVLGTILIARNIVYPAMLQNALAIAVNVGGLFLLVPTYGIAAAAWLTVAAEVVVIAGAIVLLRGTLRLTEWWLVSRRPVLALVCGAGVGALLLQWPLIAMPVSAVVFVASLAALRGWPIEMTRQRLRPSRAG